MGPSRKCLLILGAVSLIACAPGMQSSAPSIRTMSTEGAIRHHQPVQLHVDWHPYREHQLAPVGATQWRATNQVSRVGEMPVLVISYPDSAYSLSLRMDIDDALLGKLLKHTLMTQKPITAPLSEYLEEAQCGTCHPADVDQE